MKETPALGSVSATRSFHFGFGLGAFLSSTTRRMVLPVVHLVGTNAATVWTSGPLPAPVRESKHSLT